MISHCEWRVQGGEWKSHAEQSAAARQLLAAILGNDNAVEHDSHGAPYLPAHPELCISISHCRKAVAVAVSKGIPIGIDIESRRKVSPELMTRVCGPEELATVNQAGDTTMAFLQLWTRKEAVLKMRGTGIQGFGSMVNALNCENCTIEEIDCDLPDTVAALAMAL